MPMLVWNQPMASTPSARVVAVTILAGWIPSRRATRIDPTAALRYQ
jgi:ABC-type lipoprotein release transport system permease subunit